MLPGIAMSRLPKLIKPAIPAVGTAGVWRCSLALVVIGFASAALAGDIRAVLDQAAAKEVPSAIYDKISSRIARQTTFVQMSPEGLVRWSTRTLKLVEFVKAPSPTYPGTHLYAMRYVVSVSTEMDALSVHETSCQVVVVVEQNEWSEPNVVCTPVNLGQAEPS